MQQCHSTHTHTRTHYTRTHTHIHMQTNTNTHTHTYTYTHKRLPTVALCPKPTDVRNNRKKLEISSYRMIERNPPWGPPGGFPIYYVPSSRTMCERTPLEGFVPGSSREVLLHTVLDEGT